MPLLVVEREHFLARRIDVKNRFPIGRPDDAIGIRDRPKRLVEREIWVQPVEFRAACLLHQTDRPGKKTTVRRAFPVVETVIWQVLLGIGNAGQRPRFCVQQGNPVVPRDD